jgi:hypothetical protein
LRYFSLDDIDHATRPEQAGQHDPPPHCLADRHLTDPTPRKVIKRAEMTNQAKLPDPALDRRIASAVGIVGPTTARGL